MLNGDTKKHLYKILNYIQQGKIALFLGAGASHAAGGPTGEKLTTMIKQEFTEMDQSLTNFIEVCQDMIDTPPYSRTELEDFIRAKLESLNLTRSHNIMTKDDWSAIFTTNFDDLIELAYRMNPKTRLKPCQAIYSDKFQVNPSDRNKVFLFKIMGSITATEGESGCMVLSRSDYNRAIIRRRKYLELLFDFVKTGPMIFIGYSFADRLVLDIIDDLIVIYGKDRLPWSYALFAQLHPTDKKMQYMFSSRKIIPVECDFNSFFEFLEKNRGAPIEKSANEGIRLKLRGHTLTISEADNRQYAEYFEILHEAKINQQTGEKDTFFMGTNKNWSTFGENWDFKRDIYISQSFKRICYGKVFLGCLKERISKEVKNLDIETNRVLLLKGMAGVGKTMTLRRLAYDVYKSGEAPVIIINPTRLNFDYKLLASFIENLNHSFNQKIPEGQHVPPLKLVIIIDAAASLIRHVNQLKDYLSSRGRHALIIAAERTGEWDLMWKTFPFRIAEENIYELNEELTDDEKTRIIDHFHDIGYIQTKGIFWNDIIDRNFENSYFATIYSLVHPSRMPLNDIIKQQYENLTELTKKAFQYICCFHQFDLPINLELLVRSLKCSYELFFSDVIGNDAAKVIFSEQDDIGNVLYRSHHRIIARKTVEFFFGDPEMQKDILLEIFGQAILTNRKERELCEKLFVQHIGPNAKPQMLSFEQQRQLFRVICERNPVRSLVHHWGVLERADNQLLEAERLLQWALKIPRDDIESYRGESDQNILTSLGGLYAHMGIDSIKKDKIKEAEDYFQKAEEVFQFAKYGEFPNAYAYHSHAYMWYLRSRQEKGDAEQLNCYAKAIEILTVASDNLNEDNLEPIYELETIIWSQIGDETRIEKNIELLRDRFKSARGYYLNAQFLYSEAHKKHEEERKRLLRLALSKLKTGLESFPIDEYCLRLNCKILKELEPNNLANYYSVLQKWQAVASSPNAWLLFELGRTAFILGYYDFSKRYFSDLETGVGMGHKLRSRSQGPILDDKGSIREFEGTIVNLFSSYEGNLQCETLRSLKHPIAFRPIASKFTPSHGDSVRFHIAFSYRGPRAESVRKI